MRRDDKASYSGLTTITKGCHSSTAPIALPPNQLSWGVNLDCRTDFMRPRPGWVKRPLTFLDGEGAESFAVQALFEDAIFQGGIVFERFSQIVTMIGGHLFRIDPSAWSVTDISTTGDLNPSNRYRAWFCEVESWIIAQDGISIPWIYDGASTVRSDTIGAGGRVQVPIGKAMCYSQGRLIVSYATGRAFVVGDIVGGDSGTAPYDFKDSVLCFTENDVINGGGSFSVPINAGLITAFRPIAQIDTSMGQGPTQVFTTNAIFSLNTPVDRTTWATVNFPIGTVSNVANGATSDRCTPNVNGDIWFRAPDGVRAFLVARRDFQAAWINAPLSQEVSRALDGDDENYLDFASGSLFDNRLYMTTRPYRVWDHGIVHQGFVQLDFQPVATLSERTPLPTWLGNATGLRVLQVLSGNVNGLPRCFVFALNSDDKVELWEVTRKAVADSNGVAESPIQWSFETAAFSFMSPGGAGADPATLPGRELWSLDGGRFYVDEIEGDVSFDFYFRPDQDPCWHAWHSWSVCANVSPCPIPEDCGCPGLPQYRKPFFLPQPPAGCDASTNKPYHIGREFQVRAVITGRCRVKMLELVAHAQEEDVSGICAGNESCVTVRCNRPDDYAYTIPDAPVATGACCIDGECSVTTEEACVLAGGTYRGDDVACTDDICDTPPPATPTGACCIDGVCSVLTEAACLEAGGVYRGDDVACQGDTCSGDMPALPTYPPPDPYECVGRTTFGAITVTDPVEGDSAFVGINPGSADPDLYLLAYGAPGCFEAWCAEVWDQFVASGTPYSSVRLIWDFATLTGANFQATAVFPAQSGGYSNVILLNTFVTVEYCPP
jgi:hypothetical protein